MAPRVLIHPVAPISRIDLISFIWNRPRQLKHATGLSEMHGRLRLCEVITEIRSTVRATRAVRPVVREMKGTEKKRN
jgi:hypothetical protein